MVCGAFQAGHSLGGCWETLASVHWRRRERKLPACDLPGCLTFPGHRLLWGTWSHVLVHEKHGLSSAYPEKEATAIRAGHRLWKARDRSEWLLSLLPCVLKKRM